MSIVLLKGENGFIGRGLQEKFSNIGHYVIPVVRNKLSCENGLVVDISPSTNWLNLDI